MKLTAPSGDQTHDLGLVSTLLQPCPKQMQVWSQRSFKPLIRMWSTEPQGNTQSKHFLYRKKDRRFGKRLHSLNPWVIWRLTGSFHLDIFPHFHFNPFSPLLPPLKRSFHLELSDYGTITQSTKVRTSELSLATHLTIQFIFSPKQKFHWGFYLNMFCLLLLSLPRGITIVQPSSPSGQLQ